MRCWSLIIIMKKFNIAYIFYMNQATEGMKTFQGWNWFKYDKKILKILFKKGYKNFTTFPSIALDFIYHQFIKN